jgi:hypothetical protein
MLLKAYFLAAWLAVTVIGSALLPVKNARSAVVARDGKQTGNGLWRPLTDNLIQLLTAISAKRKALFDCQLSVCKTKDRKDCKMVNANGHTCYNLVSSDGRPFVTSTGIKTSWSNFACSCQVFSTKNCVVPTTIEINHNEQKKGIDVKKEPVNFLFIKGAEFPFAAKSIECLNYGDPDEFFHAIIPFYR